MKWETTTGNEESFRKWSIGNEEKNDGLLSARFPLKMSALHRELSADLESLHLRRGTHLNRIAPRGSAKTSWATFAYPLYVALNGLEPHIVIAADSSDQAEEYVEDIAEELRTNADLQMAYPRAIQYMRARVGRIRLGNGVLIRSAATRKKIRGRKWRGYRPTLIIIDDPQGLDDITSPILRQRSMTWLMKDVLKAGTPETNIIVLGTTLHRECVVCQLHSDPEISAAWESKLYRSLSSMPTRLDLWKQWEEILFNYDDAKRAERARQFFDAHQADMSEGAEVLWPAREDLYRLMFVRATEGVAAFNSEHQGEPIDPTMSEWLKEYLDWPGMWFEEWPAEVQWKKKVLGVDPSKGVDARDGDYSAIVRVAEDHRGLVFVECDARRDRSVDVICADICRHVREWEPQEIAIETNQFQELIKPILRATATALQVKLPPIIDIDNKVNKDLRIRRWTPLLASKCVRFKRRSAGTQLMIDQGRDFPNASHDDCFDGAEMALRRVKRNDDFILR